MTRIDHATVASRKAGRNFLNGLGLIALLLIPTRANARSTVTLPYAAPDVWAAAVRFLRVDRNLPVREKDEPAGYVLFDVNEAGKTYRASLELVSLADEGGRASTQAVLNIAQLPKRYEVALLEQLASKLRDERGPAPVAARRPIPPRSDAVKDSAKAPSSSVPDGGLPRAPTLPAP